MFDVLLRLFVVLVSAGITVFAFFMILSVFIVAVNPAIVN